MIPKIIHYCWFGKKQLPESAKKCIDSWKKYLPDYEICEWNEDNYNVNKIPYIREAYENKKYAFVSDYVRFDILYKYGGIYFDIDVELIKPIDDIIEENFMGQESKVDNSSLGNVVAPGLGMSAEPGLQLYRELLDYYEKKHFIKENGELDITTICLHITDILKQKGYDEYSDKIQNIAGITIYPPEYLCPMNYVTGEIHITENTRSIHWYWGSWKSHYDNLLVEKKMLLINKYGENKGFLLYKVYTIPIRLKRAVKERGIFGTIKFMGEKIRASIR